MQKFINAFFALSLIFAISCNNNSNIQSSDNKANSTNINTNSKAKLEIIYFHSTMRCVSCNAAENRTKSILEENFKAQLDKGDITFKSVNVEESENKAIAEKYKISFSTLLLIDHKNGKEVVTDFTEAAFSYANNKPDKYKRLLTSEISKISTWIK